MFLKTFNAEDPKLKVHWSRVFTWLSQRSPKWTFLSVLYWVTLRCAASTEFYFYYLYIIDYKKRLLTDKKRKVVFIKKGLSLCCDTKHVYTNICDVQFFCTVHSVHRTWRADSVVSALPLGFFRKRKIPGIRNHLRKGPWARNYNYNSAGPGGFDQWKIRVSNLIAESL